MRSSFKRRYFVFALLTVALVLGLLFLLRFLKPEEIDPHEGQVFINDGFNWVWITPIEGVDASPFMDIDFAIRNGEPVYVGDKFIATKGIDVSEHQYDINWQLVKASGVDFAFIRLGYRGYTEGGLFTDAYYERNILAASDADMDVGVYFFSQAITEEEAIEEADYVLSQLSGLELELPVVFDWEKIEGGGARTDYLDGDTLTSCAVAFCERIKAAGYTPCIYFNRYLGYQKYDLSRIDDYMLWLSVPGEYPDFYYATDIWQYSFTCEVPGIDFPTDMNIMFTPIVVEKPAEPSAEVDNPSDK